MNMSGFLFRFLWLFSLIWLLATVWRDGFSSKTVFFDRKWWKQQHKRKQAEWKLPVQLGSENHAPLESGESRTCSVEKNLWRVNARDVLFSVNLVTYMSISEVLVKTCWSNATTAKIWNLLNFCQFFARQKLEVNKIGSSATRPKVYAFLFLTRCACLVSQASLSYPPFIFSPLKVSSCETWTMSRNTKQNI